MLPHQHLLYHLKRVILPTMTVIPPERATLTEAPSVGSSGEPAVASGVCRFLGTPSSRSDAVDPRLHFP